jgi:lysophospholipase L1-like esterase
MRPARRPNSDLLESLPMHRYLLLALVLIGLPAAAMAQDEADARFPRLAALLAAGEQPVKVVCIGDSITGVYYHTGGRRAYPEILEVALHRANPKARVQVINAGISGNVLPQGLARLQKDVLDHKPQLVTIMYGMNDLTRDNVDAFKKNLVVMCQRCRSAGAEVLLCTQNSIQDGGARSGRKLAEFTAAIHEVGRENKIPVADCHAAYEAVRARDALAWALLMSDDIHPNMDGHKLFARVIARAVTGKEDALKDVGPPSPAIPRTLALLKAGKAVKVLAMPPFDKLIGQALAEEFPGAKVEVTTWPNEGQTIAELEQAAKKVRKMGMDLVIVAVPLEAGADSPERFIRSYAWVLNGALSFGHQEWDVIAAPPSTWQGKLSDTQAERDRLIRRLIAAQDLSTVGSGDGDARQALTRFVHAQVK